MAGASTAGHLAVSETSLAAVVGRSAGACSMSGRTSRAVAAVGGRVLRVVFRDTGAQASGAASTSRNAFVIVDSSSRSSCWLVGDCHTPSWRRIARSSARNAFQNSPIHSTVVAAANYSSTAAPQDLEDVAGNGVPHDNGVHAKTESNQPPSKQGSYSADQIQVLEGLDPVRKRPGMYIGSTGTRGLHHLVYEVVDNAIDEAQAGHASIVIVELLPDGFISISDDGRGIPTDIHPTTGKSALETVLTVLHAGGKFGGDDSGYKVSGGLHGVGVSVVNALSDSLTVQVWRDGKEHTQARHISLLCVAQSFSRGNPEGPLTSVALPAPESERTGTKVTFRADPTVFTTSIVYDYNTIANRLRELAFLNRQATISLRDFRSDHEPQEEVFQFSGGLAEYVQWINRDREQALHAPFRMEIERDNVTVDIAMQWAGDSYSETLLGYANSIRTSDGGTHIDGLKVAVTRVINAQARKTKALKDTDPNFSGDHAREGLTCIVAVKVPQPEFEGQTKTRLGNPDVRRIVEAAAAEMLTDFLERNPSVRDVILEKALQAYRAWEAAKKARELVRKKSTLKAGSLPGKLADCSSSDPAKAEIFIVEGDSAGGSAKQGRDRRFQAILPLRGKIMNVERQDDAKIYKNTELQNLIVALGLGIKGEDFDPSLLRYHKIIILTDADVDGAHIRTLLLTFFFRYQRSLFTSGHIYVGMPPLYKVERGKAVHYCYNGADLERVKKELGQDASYTIQRFKGLGEMMPAQLWETTMDPSRRMLKKLTMDDAAEASRVFDILMGDKPALRRSLIENQGSQLGQEALDV
eukprot:jgi/Chlat1/6236/Chrsp44S05764